jgi:nitroreductase
MDLYGAMSTQRTVRRLRPDPIPEDVLERVLQAACWAPSGGNQQPWRVVVVTDPSRKQALQELYAPEWRRYSEGFLARMEGLPEERVAPWRRVAAAGDHLADHLGEAPAVLVFCADPGQMAITDLGRDHPSVVGGGSVYPAVQNLLLACVAEGLGCALTTLHCLREDEVRQLLGIPDGWAVPAMVPIGYPVGGGHGPITRRPPSALAHRDAFGAPWP